MTVEVTFKTNISSNIRTYHGVYATLSAATHLIIVQFNGTVTRVPWDAIMLTEERH